MRRIDSKYHVDGDKIVKTRTEEEIPEDEPCFLIRGRDKVAIEVLYRYRTMCRSFGSRAHHLKSIDGMIKEFERYQRLNPKEVRVPGMKDPLPEEKGE
jgi:hypothetical protein